MKKKYLKPVAEYISLEVADIITNGYLDGSVFIDDDDGEW